MNHYVELSKGDIESAICEYIRSKATIDGNIRVELTTKPKIGISAVAVISPKNVVKAPTEETPQEEPVKEEQPVEEAPQPKKAKTSLETLVDEPEEENNSSNEEKVLTKTTIFG